VTFTAIGVARAARVVNCRPVAKLVSPLISPNFLAIPTSFLSVSGSPSSAALLTPRATSGIVDPRGEWRSTPRRAAVSPPTAPDEPVLLVHWERTLGLILDRTAQFPKSERHTFAARVDGRALDVLETLVRARWAPRSEKRTLLARADADLAVLRVLVRVCFERRLFPRAAYEGLVRALDEGGRMLGGWRRSLDAGAAP
jgi:hypothetical protein